MPDTVPAPMLPLRWPGTGTTHGSEGCDGHRLGPTPGGGGRGPGGAPATTTLEPALDTLVPAIEALEQETVAPDPGAPKPIEDSPGPLPDPAGPLDRPPEVVVRTSTRRRKTATAFWENGRIVVVMPTHVRRADRAELVDWLVARVMAKRPRAAASDEALTRRAASLADRYVDGVRPSSIRWVTNQGKRWGSCSTQTGEIRLSHRLRVVPEWVLDATIVHELAHLLHADHSPGFYAVANRYPRQPEAITFLEGYSLGLRTATA